MAAILETEPNGEMVVIEEFRAAPEGVQGLGFHEWTHFKVGDRVRLIGFFREDRPADNPIGLMARFRADPEDTQTYTAVDAYFVTVECWAGIAAYFSGLILAAPAVSRSRPAVVRGRSPDVGKRRRKAGA